MPEEKALTVGSGDSEPISVDLENAPWLDYIPTPKAEDSAQGTWPCLLQTFCSSASGLLDRSVSIKRVGRFAEQNMNLAIPTMLAALRLHDLTA
jgi:hypothetical protein